MVVLLVAPKDGRKAASMDVRSDSAAAALRADCLADQTVCLTAASLAGHWAVRMDGRWAAQKVVHSAVSLVDPLVAQMVWK